MVLRHCQHYKVVVLKVQRDVRRSRRGIHGSPLGKLISVLESDRVDRLGDSRQLRYVIGVGVVSTVGVRSFQRFDVGQRDATDFRHAAKDTLDEPHADAIGPADN